MNSSNIKPINIGQYKYRYLINLVVILILIIQSPVLSEQVINSSSVIDVLQNIAGINKILYESDISINVSFEAAGASFTIDSCDIFALNLGDGRFVGMTFNSRGSFKYSPPDQVELHQLNKFTGETSLDGEFKKGNFVFTSDVIDFKDLNFQDTSISDKVTSSRLSKTINEAYRYFRLNIINDLFEDLYSGHSGRFLYADFNLNGAGRIAFRRTKDSITLYKIGLQYIKKYGNIIGDYQVENDGVRSASPLDIKQYVINSKLEKSGKMSVDCRIYYVADNSNCQFLRFTWSSQNKLISILDSNGNNTNIISIPNSSGVFSKNNPENEFGILLKQPAAQGVREFIDIKYESNVLTNSYDMFIPHLNVRRYSSKASGDPEMYNVSMFSERMFWDSFVEKYWAPWWDYNAGLSNYRLYEKYIERSQTVEGFFEYDIEQTRVILRYGATKIFSKMPRFSKPYNNIHFEASLGWYPKPFYTDFASFEMNFDYPDDFKIVSCGSNVYSGGSSGRAASTWIVDDTVGAVNFSLGSYKSKYIYRNERPFIEIYLTENYSPSEWKERYASFGRLSFSDGMGFVGNAVYDYYKFYADLFGESRYDTLRVASSSITGHGNSSPGMIVIPWEKFQFEDYDDRSKMFIGHLVAHQWWGATIKAANYRDDWIFEGLSEYCSYYYLEKMGGNAIATTEISDDIRMAAKKGSGMGSIGSKAGPMTLGARLLSSKSEDYYPIVHAKGAYIFHMIRYLLHDYKTNSDDAFAAFLKDMVDTYRDKIITTERLHDLIEKHTGTDMSWFFNQWVYGVDIPKYNFKYKTDLLVNGKYKVVCTVKQKNVPDDFQMQIPITVLFEDDRYVHLKLWIDQPENIIELPLLPYKPRKIIFNTYDAVLCK